MDWMFLLNFVRGWENVPNPHWNRLVMMTFRPYGSLYVDVNDKLVGTFTECVVVANPWDIFRIVFERGNLVTKLSSNANSKCTLGRLHRRIGLIWPSVPREFIFYWIYVRSPFIQLEPSLCPCNFVIFHNTNYIYRFHNFLLWNE